MIKWEVSIKLLGKKKSTSPGRLLLLKGKCYGLSSTPSPKDMLES